MDELSQNQVEELLRQRIGLNPASVGSRSIMRAVRRGMRAGKMQGLTDYVEDLRDDSELFKALVESVVVPETSFFRNRASFVFLRQWVSQEWMKRCASNRELSVQRQKSGQRQEDVSPQKTPAHQKLRVLSIPCSTGEEPYSIAITLREEGLAPEDMHIDAVDISEQAIAKAKQGIYSPYAFRRQTHREDDKYFALTAPSGSSSPEASRRRTVQRYTLCESIRKSVNFIQGNVLEPGLLGYQPPYDVIFCRNLLIYLDKPARDRVLAFLDRALSRSGVLFVGYAETGLINQDRYRPVPYPQTFAYYHREASPDGHSQKTVPQVQLSTEEPTASQQEADPSILTAAQNLADSGAVELAVEQCDRYLLYYPMDAKAHLLRGELYLAVDDLTAAESCFKKAVYIDPQLTEALTHLMIAKEAQGDSEDAALLRERIRRVESLR